MDQPLGMHRDGSGPPVRLVDRLDPVIGKATNGMTTLLGELIGQALRGGVQKVDDEIEDFVAHKVDAAITDQSPRLEQLARQTAELEARQTAAEISERRIGDLEARTHRTTEQLTGRIEETQRISTDTAARTAQELATRIADAERRANDTASTLVEREIHDVVHRAKRSAARITQEVEALQQRLVALHEGIAAIQTECAGLAARHQEVLASMAELAREAGQRSDRLEARIADLEKPRGWRALWGRIAGRRRDP